MYRLKFAYYTYYGSLVFKGEHLALFKKVFQWFGSKFFCFVLFFFNVLFISPSFNTFMFLLRNALWDDIKKLSSSMSLVHVHVCVLLFCKSDTCYHPAFELLYLLNFVF